MKHLILIVFALSMLGLLLANEWFPVQSAPVAAETTPQMRLRLFVEAQQKHPDIWANCNQACIDARLQSAPFLTGLAKQAKVDLNDLVKYAVVRSFEWGQSFENLYGRPPTPDDWVAGYTDNAERLRYELAASPVIFVVNDWDISHYYRYKIEYCRTCPGVY